MNAVSSELTAAGFVLATEFACANAACSANRWLVSCRPGGRKVWLVAEAEDAGPWQIAASAPICPLCGGALVCVPSS